mgnify:CR=1 FL=1|tara:strand:- start:62 stop:748 length:687 start_codon:yes stop_codon:yes gene_type:complete
MTKSTFKVSDATINKVTQVEADVAVLKSNNKANNQEANTHKMSAYGEIIASIAHVKLTKGNLPRAVSKELYTALQDHVGVKFATAKRYVENSVGAVRLIKKEIGDIPTQYTGDAVVADLKALEIDSENKLAKKVNSDSDKSKSQRLAEQVVGKWSTKKNDQGEKEQGDVFMDGLTDEELDDFNDHVRELMAARQAYRSTKAAKEAEKQAAQENVEVNTSVDALLGDAA